MENENIKTLAEAMNEYFSQYELEELCGQFKISLVYSGTKPDHMKLAKNLLTDLDSEKNRRFLKALVEDLLARCRQTIENLPMGDNLYHQQMIPQLQKYKRLLAQPRTSGRGAGRRTEVMIDGVRSDLESFFASAQTEVIVVDTELGGAILEYLMKVQHPVRLLTSQNLRDIDRGFLAALKQFRKKGRSVDIRRHTDVHNRLILFNQRCWLAGMSLKDAVLGDYDLIEMIDFKAAIIRKVQDRWNEAKVIK